MRLIADSKFNNLERVRVRYMVKHLSGRFKDIPYWSNVPPADDDGNHKVSVHPGVKVVKGRLVIKKPWKVHKVL